MAASLRIQSEFTNDQDTNALELQSSETVTRVVERADSGEVDARSGAEDWPGLVKRIQDGDEAGMEDLYRLLRAAFAPLLAAVGSTRR